MSADPIVEARCPMCDVVVYEHESRYAWWLNNHLAIRHNYCRRHDLFNCPYAHDGLVRFPDGPTALSDVLPEN